jgi:hypothetical protein
MDELAAAAGMDPLEFRRKYLDDKRGLELLEERLPTGAFFNGFGLGLASTLPLLFASDRGRPIPALVSEKPAATPAYPGLFNDPIQEVSVASFALSAKPVASERASGSTTRGYSAQGVSQEGDAGAAFDDTTRPSLVSRFGPAPLEIMPSTQVGGGFTLHGPRGTFSLSQLGYAAQGSDESKAAQELFQSMISAGEAGSGAAFDGNWPALVQQLPLSGGPKELARNSELRSHANGVFDL